MIIINKKILQKTRKTKKDPIALEPPSFQANIEPISEKEKGNMKVKILTQSVMRYLNLLLNIADIWVYKL